MYHSAMLLKPFQTLLIYAALLAVLLSACCPVVTSFTPQSGSEGTEVTVRGKRFESAAHHNRVKFGGITVPNALITHASTDTLKVLVPADAKTGKISVDSSQCNGKSDDTFTVIGAGSRPDLIPKAIYFDSNRVLNVRIANEGTGAVPSGVGEISIYVDGRLLDNIGFSGIADQSFLAPGGSVDFSTNLRIGADHRRIMVVVDPQDDITESNEAQNSLSRTLTPPTVFGADPVVQDLSLSPSNTLRLRVRNLGTAVTPPNMSIRLRVSRNGSEVVNTTRSMPALSPGAYAIITVSAVTVNSNAEIMAAVFPMDISNDVDVTNNYRMEQLPNGPSLQPYQTLLTDPKIRANIIWHGFDSNNLIFASNYDQWSTAQKDDLDQAIMLLEREGRHTLTQPPMLTSGTGFSEQDAWHIYLAHVAHCLWTEVHQVVPWHLTTLGDAELRFLLDSRTLMACWPASPVYYNFRSILMGEITAWNPRISYQFLSNLNLIKPTQTATIIAVTDWMRAHLIHIGSSTDYTDQYGYAGPPPADRVLYPLEGKRHITAGCWGTTGLYAALLRSINIPVDSREIDLLDDNHSHPAFPSVNLSLVHGDDPYTMQLDMSGTTIPSAKLFYSLAELTNRFVNPPRDCVGSRCNSVGVQASYNQEKDQWQLAHDYFADYPMVIYASGSAAGLDTRLKGPDSASAGYEYVKPLFDAAERMTMVENIGNKLKEIGNGNSGSGGTIVMERWQRFQDNK